MTGRGPTPFEWRVLAAVSWAMSIASIMTWWIGIFPSGIVLVAVLATIIAWRATRKAERHGK